ncbi:sulfite exporter TauE/SafE family protein [Chthonobacter rhizosphaerae]|uniref:sulfite exporter TauE/SafE family protein n=1 Tax=Chthonobacter rhizosphaerae TaxID=2735553 RepID=UPI0015EE4102|nr:sulfite exporter TauE/SafE family protein [Chthonobacter rhizosphaerae]
MEPTHLLIFLAGVLAQLVDGALGMAFGVTATTVLLSFGVAPAAASTMVHVAEMFTTAASGASHIAHRNVDWAMLKRLALPGMVGGVLGSTLLANVDGNLIRPYVSAYMLVMGAIIVAKALRWRPRTADMRWAPGLGLVGGFLDAVGGGGWGPIVTSTLIGRGGVPRKVIGTVNTTEFLVTTATSAALVSQVGLADVWPVVFLVLGGLVAAPFAGWITRVMPERVLMSLVGCLVVLLATIQLAQLALR